MIEWNWKRWPWRAVSDDNRVSDGVHRRALKDREERDNHVSELTVLVGRLNRKLDEQTDQVKLRDERIKALMESERMLRSRVKAYTTLFERKQLDHMAGLPESEG